MFITIGEKIFEMSTKLGVAKSIEKKYKLPLPQLFGKLNEALSDELVEIITIAADKVNDTEFKKQIEENWDYFDLLMTVQELIARLLFSGTDEQVEEKLARYPASEEQKNAIRGLLNMPMAPATGNG